ncbi:DUF2254 domain-containing protein [Conexibacter stalactiti]|uniref:DUF2254 domain-containing protein n=1 Tax=Conexibacter stalactiti TaxID=1940611 RepID=A0ABU4HSB6_9ACTN|nr:DUF2254 domain-containing protein [Conexibacter stalactiti]MDW5596221.1 DUF2254 domain-containing protein [Conexibacter stalactiti]MEC5036863.1 DUF2254 domain-containing protein [Conexibacter stalactiti]
MSAAGDSPASPPRQQLSAGERSPSWRLRFQLREWRSRSLVLVPTLYIIAALLLAEAVPAIEERRDLLHLQLDPDTARTILSSIAGGMIAFTGLVVSIAVVVVQFGASQYTPRLVNRFRRDPIVKHALGVFVAPTIYALVSLRNIGRDGSTVVPSVTVGLNLLLLIAAMLAFFGLVSRLLDLLRPRRVIAQVVERAGEAVLEAYPFPFDAAPPRPSLPPAPVGAVVRHEGRAGVLATLDRAGIVALARAAGALVEVTVPIGGFVPRGAPLFRVHGAGERIDAAALRRTAMLAEERTISQDPAFAIRAIADIGLRALSPAVNDPTTGVQALDGIEELLRELTARDLERGQIADDAGTVRLVYPNPGWADLLDLSLTEIRVYGVAQPQIARRMRALLLGLLDGAPEPRRPALEAQLARLDAAVARAYPDPVERAHAEQPDRLGIGGAAALTRGV